jgi:type VI secretion system FHA domain protein
MATLILTVLRCPDAVVPEQRRTSGGELSLGRGGEADWTLADPDKVLSKRHCLVEFVSGGWQLRDLSTNGTFVNGAAAPVGRGQARALMDGDRLKLGPYEIEVRIEEARPAPPPRGAAPLPDLPATAPAPQPLAAGGIRPPLLPDDLGLMDDFGPPMPDHAQSSSDAFMLPPMLPAGRAAIPDDWALDLDLGTPAAPFAPEPPAVPRAAPPAVAPVAPAAADPFAEAGDRTFGGTAGQRPASRAAATQGSQHPGLEAFLAGARVDGTRARLEPVTTLRVAGALLHTAVAGIRALLRVHSESKRPFHVARTALTVAHSNPLKFAATDEQATAALLDPNFAAVRALDEVMDDLKIHEIAVSSATQEAARALLAKLAPDAIEAEDPGGGLLPGGREKRLWEAYRQRHAALVAEFEDDFGSAFGKAIADADERASDRRRP